MLAVIGMLLVTVACQRSHRVSNDGMFNSGIVNGTDANGSEAWFGSVIAIGTKSSNGKGFEVFCSGSLIGKNTIVTAGHCLDYQGVGAYVIFGLKQDSADVQGRKIVKAAFHEKYDGNFPESARDVFDIGVAQFEGELPNGFNPVEILTDDSILKNGAEILLAGFGVTNGYTQAGAGTLRYTSVKIQDEAYGKTEVQTDEKKNGSCNGDSGGPGLVSFNGKYYVWGTTSRGDAACVNNGIYTKVTSYKQWIDAKISEWDSGKSQGNELPLALLQ